jgi:hypothetical protein
MVFVYSNTLSISPSDPYTTDSIRVSAWIGVDLLDGGCQGIMGYTRTNIYLMRRNVGTGETRSQAVKIAMYDCSTKCCLDPNIYISVPGHPGRYGWEIGFDAINPIPTPGKYEFFVVDEGDYRKTTYPQDRTAALTFTVAQDPVNPPIITIPPVDGNGGGVVNPCEGMNRDGSLDPTCIMEKGNEMYLYGAIGVVVLLVLLSSKRRK